MIIGNVRLSGIGSSRHLHRRDRRRDGRNPAACLVIVLLSLLFSCGPVPRPKELAAELASYGSANRGRLISGVALPDSGPGYIRAKVGEDTRWSAPLLQKALERAASSVARELPGGAPLVIGDLSARHGGPHARHGSHRSGRDADVLFYILDVHGRSVRGSGFYAFDERGASTIAAPQAPVAGTALFDTARNWLFVRALVLDEQVPAQWIFCADGIKALLLAYAAEHERDPRALVRAAYVLHQPSSGNPHRDHFHIRIPCTASERALGCQDDGPIWPWIRLSHEKPERTGSEDDATLVRALLEDSKDPSE
jgi:penicillin-insensitive murein DD-endopeptidase